MLIEHQSKRPNIDLDAYVAPTAVICGDVTVGPRTHVYCRGDRATVFKAQPLA